MTENAPPVRRWSRKHRLLWALAALAAFLVLVVWLNIDLPRQHIERILELELRAEVDLGSISVLGRDRFLLRDLVIRRMGGQPHLGFVRVASIVVEGPIGRVRRAHFDLVRVRGVQVLLRPPTGERLPEPSDEPSTLRIGRLVVEDGTLIVQAGGGESRLPFRAELRGIAPGGDVTGDVSAAAARFPLDPVLALALATPGANPLPQTTVEALRAAIVLQRGAAIDGSLTSAAIASPAGRLPGLGVRGRLTPAADARTLLVEATADLPGVERSTGAATLDASTRELLRGSASLRGIELTEVLAIAPALAPGVELDGRADLEIVVPATPRARVVLDGRLRGAVVRRPGLDVRARDVVVHAEGDLVQQQGPITADTRVSATARSLAGTIGGVHLPGELSPLRLEARGAVTAGRDGSFDGSARARTGSAGVLDVVGRTRWGGTPATLDARWTWSGLELARARAVARSLGATAVEGLDLAGRVRASGSARGPLTSPAVDATVRFEQASVAPVGAEQAWSLAGATGGARVLLPAGWRTLELRDIDLRGTGTLPPLAPLPVRATGGATVDLGRGTVRVRDVAVGSEGLGSLALAGDWDGRRTPAGRFDAVLREVVLARWRPVLEPLVGDPLAGYEIKGSASADLDATLDVAGAWAATGTAAVRGSGFASADGARVLEGLDSTWSVRARGATGSLQVEADAAIGGFQLLWGAVYADYAQVASSAQVSFRSRPQGWQGELHWTLPDDGPVLHVSAAGAPEHATTATGTMAVPELSSTVARYLRAPLGGSLPFFEKIQARGAAGARVSASVASDARSVSGQLVARDVHLEGTQGVVALDGMTLDLPFDLRWQRTDDGGWVISGGETLPGSVEYRSVTLSGLELPPLRSELAIEADTVTFREELGLNLLGGLVRFDNLRLTEVLRDSRRLRAAVLISDLDLEQASASFGLPALEGSVYASVPEMTLTEEKLQVEGGGQVQLFGGTVRLGDISGEDVFSRFPKIELSADFEGIDLGRVTRRFDVGEMNGVVAGYVRDLRLFRGVPVQFEALIESVPTSGVKQNVNVKAINNIAILGTGGDISPLDRGLHRFLDTYTYAKLGIWMKLQNDVFLLRGTAGEGERELFLRGRFPFPINIVNAQPGTRVSFRSMVERVKAIDFGTASTAQPAAAADGAAGP